jgi:hypothetical protein
MPKTGEPRRGFREKLAPIPFKSAVKLNSCHFEPSEESRISNAEILRGVDLRAKRKAQNDRLGVEGFGPYLKGIEASPGLQAGAFNIPLPSFVSQANRLILIYTGPGESLPPFCSVSCAEHLLAGAYPQMRRSERCP